MDGVAIDADTGGRPRRKNAAGSAGPVAG